ncbi:MAG: formylglycine-generating enzyme family protein [Bacteroidales bacterium]|jgi:formylglycine-generating enzyme required for sulfatase activity|nr:formylglycine-generating enzyme family protein [Bacteroidales bacterium]
MLEVKNKILTTTAVLFFTGLSMLFSCKTETGGNPVPVSYQGDLKELFAGPAEDVPAKMWLDTIKRWRSAERKLLHYDGSEYERPEFSWLKHTFVYAQMMVHDRYFYDVLSGKYTVDKFLNDLKERYGGVDALLIWPTYPNIGIDNRNQYDLVADMPGGIEGVAKMTAQLKKRGVRVFFPIMIWDKGTKPTEIPMAEELVKEMKEIGADGLNGDTMFGVTEDFKKAYEGLHYPLLLQPEVAINDLKGIEWNLSSWGYFWKYTFRPGVSVYKWLEPRHQVYVTNRWIIDKTDDLQYAFFNGIGYNSWENVWGIWNGIPDRYAEEIKKISAIYRHFSGIWNSERWQPYFPVMQKGVFASAFPGKDKTIYTFINRDSSGVSGMQIKLPYSAEMEYFDLWHGNKLNPFREDDSVCLSFDIEGKGFGALAVVKRYDWKDSDCDFLAEIKGTYKPLGSLSTKWEPLVQHIVDIPGTAALKENPEGMILVRGTDKYSFESSGVMIEGNDLPDAVGIQYPWQKHPARAQKHIMNIHSFYIDRYPVTNEQFKKFMDATGYKPRDPHNFLKYWENGTYLKGTEKEPVTWVSLEDTRAYCKWCGKRLPHEWEWQYAAQGTDGRSYPWGKEFDKNKIPEADSSRIMRKPTDVSMFPAGASPFGVMDLVGNVWQWTDEYYDEHTRFAVLKGGSYYKTQTSDWYFPQVRKLNEYGKYLLMSPSLDRSATIGFRCVSDL